MIRISRVIRVATLAASFAGAENAHAQTLQDNVVLADELRTAFYEQAPKSLAASMSKAVVSWCAAGRTAPHADALAWLCRGPKPVYFRNVYVNGARGRHGLVCESSGTTSLKYFGIDLVADVVGDGSCVPADFDGSRYELRVDEVRDGDA